MEKSVLTITIIEARYISPSDYNAQNDLYVLVECANQTAQTKHLENMQNPIWDESFQFDIYNGKEEIRVMIMSKNAMKQDILLGELYLPINTLSDQVKVEDWYNLEAPHGNSHQTQGRIRLQLWWIHSKIKLIEDRIIQTEEDIDKIFEDKKYYQDKVSQLREPFEWMESTTAPKPSPNRPSSSQFKSYADDLETEDEESKLNPIIRVTGKVTGVEKTLARGFEKFSDNLSQGLGLRYTPWYLVMVYSNVLYTILTLGT